MLHGSHATRHAEGRGYGREDRNGGLNDEAPYLSFLFIHDFSFRLRVRLMSTFLSVFGGNARTSEEDNQYNFYNILQPSYPCRKAGCNIVLAKLLFWLFTLQQDCSRRSVVHRCKSCFSCFPYSAGCIETTRYNFRVPPFEDKKTIQL